MQINVDASTKKQNSGTIDSCCLNRFSNPNLHLEKQKTAVKMQWPGVTILVGCSPQARNQSKTEKVHQPWWLSPVPQAIRTIEQIGS